jgi:hypothetical protein
VIFLNKGKLIVLESGTDSSGKETQTNLLFERLKKDKINVLKVEYPEYKSESSSLIIKILTLLILLPLRHFLPLIDMLHLRRNGKIYMKTEVL